MLINSHEVLTFSGLDEEGVTVTLDRFDPGRNQAGASDRVPSALLPGDVLVPCLFCTQMASDAVVQSEEELLQHFKVGEPHQTCVLKIANQSSVMCNPYLSVCPRCCSST